jgi:hypothetical protein
MTIGILGAVAVAASGCGSSKTFANKPRPAAPINLTVYINDSRVSVSPASVGAGPIVFIVTNQARHAESLQIQPQGGSSSTPLADTGPINSQATAQVKVGLPEGDYNIGIASSDPSQAGQAIGTGIRPARLHIGPPRPSGNNLLLQP